MQATPDRRMIVATAGHIDHGKTALVKALTGTDTDRLPEEKKRGISIDLGYASWQPPEGEPISFVDVPGHERFIRNMLAGVCAIDRAMLVVAADDGPMPQTLEHLQILDLLGISEGLVVISKADRVAPDRLAEVQRTLRATLAPTGLAALPMVPASAVTRAGIEQVRGLLSRIARGRQAVPDTRAFRHVVDRSFSVAGSGTVVTGTVLSGAARIGDRLRIAPDGAECRIRAIQRHGRSIDCAGAGERCALNVVGVTPQQAARGTWLVAPQMFEPTSRIDASVTVPPDAGGPLGHWTAVHLHIGAAIVPARLAIRRSASIAPGSCAVVQLRLDRSISAVRGDRFVLRDASSSRTLAGGRIIDPFPTRRRGPSTRLSAMQHEELPEMLAALLEDPEDGVDLDWLDRAVNPPANRVAAVLDSLQAQILGRRFAYSGARVRAIQTAALQTLQTHHEAHRQSDGLDIEALRRGIARTMPPQAFVDLLRPLTADGRLAMRGGRVSLPRHDPTDNPRDRRTWEIVHPLLQTAGFQVPMVRELSRQAGVPEALLRDFLHRKRAGGEIVRLTPERFVLRETLSALAGECRATAAQRPDHAFSVGDYRDRIGTGRGLAIEILEELDRIGVTSRRGNLRTVSTSG